MKNKIAEFFYRPIHERNGFYHNYPLDGHMLAQRDALWFSLKSELAKEFKCKTRFNENNFLCAISFESNENNQKDFEYALLQHFKILSDVENNPRFRTLNLGYNKLPFFAFTNKQAEKDVLSALALYNKTLSPRHPDPLFQGIKDFFRIPRRVVKLEEVSIQ